jgi:hypothetical protein
VDQILVTSDTFPPKESADQVAVLSRMPARAHRELAELRVGDTWFKSSNMQHKILDRAATLGADAVVFAKPDTQTLHHMAYEPAYDPWAYDSLYYGGPYGGLYGGWGPWAGLYPGSIAVPYDETVRMLMGTAIRYTDILRETGEPSSERSRAHHGKSEGRSQSRP